MTDKVASFFCAHCGNESRQWMGFCHMCGAQDPLVEAPRAKTRRGAWLPDATSEPVELSRVSEMETPRISLPYPELNRILGGGLVPGSVVLLAGDPGIGKSTLLLQAAAALADSSERGGVLYVSGEESPDQVQMRARRLRVRGQGLYLLGETNLEAVLHWLGQMSVTAVVVDSIQTLYSEGLSAAPGSLIQVRECTRRLLAWAKEHGTPVLLAGHVTKEGDVAGPRALEHMVDVVLYLEGERFGANRLLRGTKNRFGATHEVAVYQMEEQGLVEVHDPSRVLLSHRRGAAVGSAVVAVVEGTRPLLVEVQALTSPAHGPVPRRVVNGMEVNRVIMVAAVLARRAGLPLGGQDIIVNVVGGLRLSEPAADLAVALAIASSFREAPLDDNIVALGEVGLSGEVRPVPQIEQRLQEASRLGFRRAVVGERGRRAEASNGSVEVLEVATLRDALRHVLPRRRTVVEESAEAVEAAPGRDS